MVGSIIVNSYVGEVKILYVFLLYSSQDEENIKVHITVNNCLNRTGDVKGRC